jgi:hypothetical protein
MVAALRALRADNAGLDQLAVKMMTDFFIAGNPQVVTRAHGIAAIDREIAKQTAPGAAQSRYLATMETMMGFVDQGMHDGVWRVLRTTPAAPFVIGDAPASHARRMPPIAAGTRSGGRTPGRDQRNPYRLTTWRYFTTSVEK